MLCQKRGSFSLLSCQLLMSAIDKTESEATEDLLRKNRTLTGEFMTKFAVMLGFNGMESGSTERQLTSFCSFCCRNIRRKKKTNYVLTKITIIKTFIFKRTC